jgi:hypothetical protein
MADGALEGRSASVAVLPVLRQVCRQTPADRARSCNRPQLKQSFHSASMESLGVHHVGRSKPWGHFRRSSNGLLALSMTGCR